MVFQPQSDLSSPWKDLLIIHMGSEMRVNIFSIFSLGKDRSYLPPPTPNTPR